LCYELTLDIMAFCTSAARLIITTAASSFTVAEAD